MSKLVALTAVDWESTGGDKGTRWSRIGVAFKLENGGLRIILDSLPVNGVVIVQKDKPRDEQQQRPKSEGQQRGQRGGQRGGGERSTSDDDDDIPF